MADAGDRPADRGGRSVGGSDRSAVGTGGSAGTDPAGDARDDAFADAGGRDVGRAAAAAACALAVLLAATVVPLAASAGLGGSPAGSLVPVEALPTTGDPDDGEGFGALSPGTRTSVGGDLGGTNPRRSLSAEVHFVAESSAPTYWRTGAYDTYTGTSWERSNETRPVTGPLSADGPSAGEVRYEVTLNRSASALPTPWRPVRVSRDDVRVTGTGALRVDEPLSSGTTYAGTSARPPDEVPLLRSAGTDYPEGIEARYTSLPGGTRERLAAFAARVTENASTPYERAVLIERWLEEEKAYALEVAPPAEGLDALDATDGAPDVASRFVFEMDAGYCEYFATAMAVMLRAQGVPARYVVGYTAGDRVGENAYAIRELNAHAWVEVYFPDAGWVRFDPTPAEPRLAREATAYERQRGEGYDAVGLARDDLTVRTPPITGDAGSAVPSDGDDDAADDDGSASLDLEFDRTPVPGAPVTGTVTRMSRPVVGATVRVAGEPVGETNLRGEVRLSVPYVESLAVSAAGGTVTGVPPQLATDEATVGNWSYDLETTATVSVTGERVTAGEVVVAASVGELPVEGAAVRVNGTRAATTDAAGRATVTLPPEPGNVTLAVTRGAVSGRRTLSLPALAVDADPALPVALPWTPVSVNATLGGSPAAGLPVAVNGRRVGTTGPDGTVDVVLPATDEATVAVRGHGQTQRTGVDGARTNLGLLGGTVAALAGLVALGVRRDVTVRGSLARAGRGLRRAVVTAPAALVGLSGSLDAALDALARALRAAGGSLRALAQGRTTVPDLAAALRDWLADRRAAAASRAGGEPPAGSAAGGIDRDAHTVRAAWASFLTHVSAENPRTRTPGELATHAVVSDGLPPEPVGTLRDAYRAVEYGARDPGARVGAVERAVARVEAAAEGHRDDGGRDGTARKDSMEREDSKEVLENRDDGGRTGGEPGRSGDRTNGRGDAGERSDGDRSDGEWRTDR